MRAICVCSDDCKTCFALDLRVIERNVVEADTDSQAVQYLTREVGLDVPAALIYTAYARKAVERLVVQLT